METETVHLGVYDTLADWEFGYAVAHINDPQWQRCPGRYRVRTVAGAAGSVTTAGGLRIVPDLTLAELDPSDSAMLILPGAAAWGDRPMDMARTARTFLDHGVPVAAICGATAGLAREGLLDERAHTSSAAEYLVATGYGGASHYREQAVVTDGLVTTAGPQSAVDFAHEIFRVLDVYGPVTLDAWYALYRHQDARPFGGHDGGRMVR